ncbi:hypothetical protein BBK36DRAFT_1186644 [Trichoderma citrinoviride]|uniref:AAA+ ATPase domain-containing protein n=1 Tax=Trichoderma citrinoviride TaxID=58853 RepID=A0A2T4BIY4_9HYPO|nr:hypothetical protein BBK36DRAFT_1186644 [Trichoderma citrinoviride]PTB69277.1 hypothetical protein BBK36DRAFT_1186644 [Trichoderma citrinoviride]
MTSDDLQSGTNESRTGDPASTTMASTLLSSNQGGGPDGGTGGNAKSTAQEIAGFTNDIANLKKMIQQLEERQKGAAPVDAEQEGESAKRRAYLEEYKRMEGCLYKHRKEWEIQSPPTYWKFWASCDYNKDGRNYRNSYLDMPYEYKRPDPFDPTHDCGETKVDANTGAHEDFDYEIDYGHRRERLRKNFEWDLDRLYLAEEADRRRREKERPPEPIPPEEEEEEEERLDSSSVSPSTYVIPKQNRVRWPVFKTLHSVAEEKSHVLDVLIGEPTIDEDLREYRWYGRSSQRPRKGENVQNRKAEETNEAGLAPFPERIRIHSSILRYILAEILGSKANSSLADVNFSSTVVFVRPFRAIFYCRGALQDWYTALEKKLRTVSEAEKNDLDAPEEPSTVSNPDTHASGHGPDPSLAEESPAVESFSAKEFTAMKTVQAAQDSVKGGTRPGGEREDVAAEEEEGEEEEEQDKGSTDITKSPTALVHLRCLLDFIESDISKRLEYLSGPQCRKILFSDLWLLFRPGMEVIGSDGKQAYRVIGVSSANHRAASPWERWYSNAQDKRRSLPFNITCIYIDFDGKNLGPVTKVFYFKKFEGEKEVTLLEVYPLRFHPVKRSDFDDSMWAEVEALPPDQRYRQKLIRRGAMFLDVVTIKHMYYAGPTLDTRDDVEGQVVVDFETAFSVEDETQKAWKPDLQTLIGNPPVGVEDDNELRACHGPCCSNDFVYDDLDMDEQQKTDYINSLLPSVTSLDEQPSVAILPRPLSELRASSANATSVSDDELAIMSYRVFGFVLRTRKWAKLDLTYMTAIQAPDIEDVLSDEQAPNTTGSKKQRTAFDRLVIKKEHRSMIVSLVAQHFRDKRLTSGHQQQFDIVKGKGKGLILLLHGAPGVGKTSTAEGIAELFKKPLFQITCGDLGTTAAEVEMALETNFALANRWDCILLLDEADVFLAERTKEDFQRNGLVAVFLRVMEYYAGILFLTTNRVGDFDEAFTSRIHVSLYYPELDAGNTLEIFDNNLTMIEGRFAKKNRVIHIDRSSIRGFATKHYYEHPQARWNGRQIRNACQTALALAEYEAQGNSHEAILKPDAVINLSEAHFQTVQNAYLEFTSYMNTLYGTGAAQRAKEGRLRAVWIDENNCVVDTTGMSHKGQDKMAAFLKATQGPLPQQKVFMPNSPPPPQQYVLQQPQYPQGFQPPHDSQQRQLFQQAGVPQQIYQHQTVLAPQPVYPGSSQVQPQHVSVTQTWNHQNDTPGNASFQGPTAAQSPLQVPRSMPPQQSSGAYPLAGQQQQQPNAQQFGQSPQSMYTTPSQ